MDLAHCSITNIHGRLYLDINHTLDTLVIIVDSNVAVSFVDEGNYQHQLTNATVQRLRNNTNATFFIPSICYLELVRVLRIGRKWSSTVVKYYLAQLSTLFLSLPEIPLQASEILVDYIDDWEQLHKETKITTDWSIVAYARAYMQSLNQANTPFAVLTYNIKDFKPILSKENFIVISPYQNNPNQLNLLLPKSATIRHPPHQHQIHTLEDQEPCYYCTRPSIISTQVRIGGSFSGGFIPHYKVIPCCFSDDCEMKLQQYKEEFYFSRKDIENCKKH